MKKILSVLFSLICVSQLMSSDINWSFPPTTLSTGLNANDPRIAMDPNGNSVAVWLEGGVLKSKFKLIGFDWGSVATVSGTSASFPSVVIDPFGNAAAVWLEGTVVKAATKPYKNAWSSPVTLSGTAASSPALAVDAAGNLAVAWARNGDIQTSVKLFGANWQSQGTINTPGNGASLPSIAIGGSGSNATAVIVWHSSTANPVNIVYASTKPISSGTWSAARAISDVAHQAAYAHVAVDKNGNTTAIWYSFDVTGPVYSSVVVQSSTRPFNSGNWSSSHSLSDPGIRNPATLAARVAYDVSGNALALWSTSFDDETFSIQSAIHPVYGSWTSPTVLINSNLYSFQTDLSVCSLGDALALYLFYNGAALQIQSSELDITGFMNSIWSVPLTISVGTLNAYPAVAAALTGNVINSAAVWLSANGVINSVVASTGSKTLVSPPTNLSVTQSTNNFGVFTEYYNTLSWQASTDPTAVGYLIYRNGVFLQQVDSNTLQIVDDNRVQNGPVTYGVATIDNQQSHSPIVTISFP